MIFERFPDIKRFIKLKTGRFKQSGDWVETFCPYCNDRYRKPNPRHGHLYMAKRFPFFHCFRCSERGHLIKLLKELEYDNVEVLKSLSELYKGYRFTLSPKIDDNFSLNNNPYIYIEKVTYNFRKQYNESLYDNFLSYLDMRSIDIDHIQYLIYPMFFRGHLYCAFCNYELTTVVARVISDNFSGNVRRYQKIDSGYYFWQAYFDSIIEYSEIVFTESPFDIINLSRFFFKNTKNKFFFSMQNQFYYSNLKKLISSYLRIGSYTIHIFLDKDYKGKRKLIEASRRLKYIINPKVKIFFYTNYIGKDMSECSAIERIQEV